MARLTAALFVALCCSVSVCNARERSRVSVAWQPPPVSDDADVREAARQLLHDIVIDGACRNSIGTAIGLFTQGP